jgi:hypothetical protein
MLRAGSDIARFSAPRSDTSARPPCIRQGFLLNAATGLAERIDRFLQRVRPMLVRQADVPARSVTVTSLEILFSKIRGPVGAACAGGAFMNVWKVAGLKRSELRNAATLAWLLDPRGTHGLADAVLRALLGRVKHAPTWLVGQTDFRQIRVVTEESPVGSTENRVDISITGPTFLIFLEVKIDAQEGFRQLERYRVEAENKALSLGVRNALVVYMTVDGRPPKTDDEVATLSWRDVERAVGDVARALPREDIRRLTLNQFATHVRTF